MSIYDAHAQQLYGYALVMALATASAPFWVFAVASGDASRFRDKIANGAGVQPFLPRRHVDRDL
jgi:hypothetical protein